MIVEGIEEKFAQLKKAGMMQKASIAETVLYALIQELKKLRKEIATLRDDLIKGVL